MGTYSVANDWPSMIDPEKIVLPLIFAIPLVLLIIGCCIDIRKQRITWRRKKPATAPAPTPVPVPAPAPPPAYLEIQPPPPVYPRSVAGQVDSRSATGENLGEQIRDLDVRVSRVEQNFSAPEGK